LISHPIFKVGSLFPEKYSLILEGLTEEGKAEGIVEGIAKGKAENCLEIARNMKFPRTGHGTDCYGHRTNRCGNRTAVAAQYPYSGGCANCPSRTIPDIPELPCRVIFIENRSCPGAA